MLNDQKLQSENVSLVNGNKKPKKNINSTKPYSPTYNSIKYTHVRLVKQQNCKISCTMGFIETNSMYEPLKQENVPTEMLCKNC